VNDLVGSHKRMRIALVGRVRARRAELEQAVFARVRDSAVGLQAPDDPEYVAGLRSAVVAAIEHGLFGVEAGEEGAGPAPVEAVEQARRAARAGVSLDTVVRRYVLGSTVLGDFLMQEAESPDFAGNGCVLREALRAQAAVLERLIAAVNVEYAGEVERSGRSPEQRRAERVLELLAGSEGNGEAHSAEFRYEFAGWHVGVIANGTEAASELARCASGLGCSSLLVTRAEGTVWAWFGTTRRVGDRDLTRALRAAGPEVSLAVGEPAQGIEGWRLTHRQAQAALSVALHERRSVTRYAEVALVASALRDEFLCASLVDIYLSPLGGRNNGGAVLRQTLLAYFAADRNASSAASALGVSRHTVENRLRTIEDKLGRSLRSRQAELEVALRLEELDEDGDRAGVR
jgi:PucR C-terminal helix-turn-helix domain/GGDEF-like domain